MSFFSIGAPRTENYTLGADGVDHRVELGDVTNPTHLMQARSVACLTMKSQLTATASGYSVAAHVPTLGGHYNLAPGENFADQQMLGGGTAFLVGNKRYVLTAGHCLFDKRTGNRLNEKDFRLVFDFAVTNGSTKTDFDAGSVYKVKRVVGFEFKHSNPNKTSDWALLELDRDVEGREPLEMHFHRRPSEGKSVHMWGHPSGLPMKFAEHAEIQSRATSPALPDTRFPTSLNAFSGNSGSPVFNSATNKVLGILVSGPIDLRTGHDYSRQADGKMKPYKTDRPTNCQSLRNLLVVEKYLQAVEAIGDLEGKDLAKVQEKVGQWIARGKHGLCKSESLATKFFKQAAKNGDKHRALQLGYYYKCKGKEEKAFKYTMLGAKAGCKDAQYKVGKWLYYGKYTEENEEKGLCWLHKSAQKGGIWAIQMLGNVDPDWEDAPPPVKPLDSSKSRWESLNPCYWINRAASYISSS
ncbi:MAG: bifunctional trypsin-like peptidase domain-containing/SEL1-like repeat protein [Chlamydiota bacterium]